MRALTTLNHAPAAHYLHPIAHDGRGAPGLPTAFDAHVLWQVPGSASASTKSPNWDTGQCAPQSFSCSHSPACLLKQFPSRPRRIGGALGMIVKTRPRL